DPDSRARGQPRREPVGQRTAAGGGAGARRDAALGRRCAVGHRRHQSASRRVRFAALPLAAAGLAAGFLGSLAFVDRFGTDPFLTAVTPMSVTTLASEAAAEFSVPFEVSGMWLSPAATHVALASEDEEEETTIHAGRVGG